MKTNIFLAINITLMYSAPLIFGALGSVISERSGVINLAIEGIMTIGAFAAATAAYYTGNPWLGFIAGGIFGAILSIILAAASVSFKSNQSITGIALNFLGPGLALFFCRIIFDGATMTPAVPSLPKIFSFIDNINDYPTLSLLNIDSTSVIAFIFVILMYIFFYKTKWGLRVTAVGEHPAAADTLGVNVSRVRYLAVIASGFFAGLGGAACSLAIVSNFRPSIIAGKGFIAIAAVIFGKWTPHGAFGACILFGFAQALVVLIGATNIPIPGQIISMLPYVLTIAVLILFVGKAVAPRASGQPYEKGKR